MVNLNTIDNGLSMNRNLSKILKCWKLLAFTLVIKTNIELAVFVVRILNYKLLL